MGKSMTRIPQSSDRQLCQCLRMIDNDHKARSHSNTELVSAANRLMVAAKKLTAANNRKVANNG